MKQPSIPSFFNSLVISFIVTTVVYLLYLIFTFDLAGGETLSQLENERNVLLFISILLLLIAFLFGRKFFLAGNKPKAIGILLLPVITFVAVIIYFISCFNYHTTFDQQVWQRSEQKPFSMAATLVKENKLSGLSRQQVRDLLGKPNEEYVQKNVATATLIYIIKGSWKMTVFFKEWKAIETELRRPWLGL